MILNKTCPNCGHRFEREEGFFIGAMIISYFISTLLALPVLLITVFKYEVEFVPALVVASAMMLITGPIIYRYSKLAWIHIEESLYQSFKAKRDERKR
jgi:hypothetical protein